MPEPRLPALPCPECAHRGLTGNHRIGNRRNICDTCNNFAQNVMRLTRKRLLELHPDEYQRLRLRAELDLYPQVLENYKLTHPLEPIGIKLDDLGMPV